MENKATVVVCTYWHLGLGVQEGEQSEDRRAMYKKQKVKEHWSNREYPSHVGTSSDQGSQPWGHAGACRSYLTSKHLQSNLLLVLGPDPHDHFPRGGLCGAVGRAIGRLRPNDLVVSVDRYIHGQHMLG